jgi:hypothetical protein
MEETPMESRSALFVTIVGLCFSLVAPQLIAGGIIVPKLPESTGLQLLKPGDANARPGSIIEAVVLNPEKLSKLGIVGARPNDRVLVKVGENGNHEIRLARTGEVRRVSLRDGNLHPAPQINDPRPPLPQRPPSRAQ